MLCCYFYFGSTPKLKFNTHTKKKTQRREKRKWCRSRPYISLNSNCENAQCVMNICNKLMKKKKQQQHRPRSRLALLFSLSRRSFARAYAHNPIRSIQWLSFLLYSNRQWYTENVVVAVDDDGDDDDGNDLKRMLFVLDSIHASLAVSVRFGCLSVSSLFLFTVVVHFISSVFLFLFFSFISPLNWNIDFLFLFSAYLKSHKKQSQYHRDRPMRRMKLPIAIHGVCVCMRLFVQIEC